MIRLAFTLACISIPAIASADTWNQSAEFKHSNAASIRVIEPDGYRVSIGGRLDSVPAVFAQANADAYVVMSVTAPSGASWETKVEVRPHTQTVVRVRHVADAPAAPAQSAKVASYVGIVFNTSHLCKTPGDRTDVRLEFILGADVVKAIDVAKQSRLDVELPGGEYRVRHYKRGKSGWELHGSGKRSIAKDGWNYEFGCAQ